MFVTLWLGIQAALAAPEMIPPQESIDLVGRTAPPIEAPLLGGGDFDLSKERGAKVVLSFWASWCGPCRKELPALAELAKQRKDVKFYAVNVDRDDAAAKRFLEQVKFDLPIVWDNQSKSMGQYNVLSMPTMFLIDANGTVKWRKTGFSAERGLGELEAQLDGRPYTPPAAAGTPPSAAGTPPAAPGGAP
jgi:thiol-disulfide isomerase/thioredoxin